MAAVSLALIPEVLISEIKAKIEVRSHTYVVLDEVFFFLNSQTR
jgi:hypothetical protein